MIQEKALITHEPVDLKALQKNNADPSCGAIACFLGTVRNYAEGKPVQKLAYEAYEEMAQKKIRQIILEIENKYPPVALRVIHRLGELQVGEVSLWIEARSPHRKEAFAALTETVDRIKAEVPIWKKEFFADGTPSRWVHCPHCHPQKRNGLAII